MVLIIGESFFYHYVQHGPWVGDGHLGLLLITGSHHKVLRKGVGKDTPDAVSVQLKGPPEVQRSDRCDVRKMEMHCSICQFPLLDDLS